MPAKLDLKKDLKHLYNPSAKGISVVTVPAMNFLMIDGMGDPNTSLEFADAMQTLFPLAYSIKFAIKKETGQDFAVMPPEGLWWSDDTEDFLQGRKDNWHWTVMIAQPDFVKKSDFVAALDAVKKKGKAPAVDKVRFERYDEGDSVQILHIGPFVTEHDNILKLHDFIRSSGHQLHGKHHEIYLSDFRRVAPEKLKTVIRQPFC